MDLLRQDIAAIKKDVTSLVGGSLGAVNDRARELIDETREKATEIQERIGKSVAERPITTIAVAFAAGAVGMKLYSWLSRR